MKLHTIKLLFTATGLISAGTLAMAQSTPSASASSSVPADNTKNNHTDPTNGTSTADMQQNDTSDLELTKRIRQRIVADKSLSTYAHNVKIVSVSGTVTLNGVVRSEQEKSSIEMKAIAIAGRERVVNDLKVSNSR